MQLLLPLLSSSGVWWCHKCKKKSRCGGCFSPFCVLLLTGTHHMTRWQIRQGEMEDWVFLSTHITLLFAFHSSKVSVMPICLSPSSAAASSISYLKYRTRNDYLCPEISSSDSSVNSFGKQMLIHHISLTRIQNWLPWHQLNCEWQTLFQDFDKLVH